MQEPQPPEQLPRALRDAQTARQPSFAQRRAEARALTPRGADAAQGEGGEDDPFGSPRSERLPPPAAVRMLDGSYGVADEGSAMPPAILRERRDLETALYRI